MFAVKQLSSVLAFNKFSKYLSFQIMDSDSLSFICRKFSSHEGGKFILEKDDESGLGTLIIDNRNRKNAISGFMMTQLRQILTELESWKMGKALLIHGVDETFCSGGDINTVKNIASPEGGRQMAILMQDNLQRLQQLPILTVALIQGKAIGGGAEFTTACDFRLITATGQLGFVQVKMGITVGWGGGARLTQILGPTKALELMLSGRQLTGQEAVDIGLCNAIIEEKDASAVQLAKSWIIDNYTQSPTQIIRSIKSIVNVTRNLSLKEALEKELEIFANVWGGPAHITALSKNLKHR